MSLLLPSIITLFFSPTISLYSVGKNLISLICRHPFSRDSSVNQDEQEIDFTVSPQQRRKTKWMPLWGDTVPFLSWNEFQKHLAWGMENWFKTNFKLLGVLTVHVKVFQHEYVGRTWTRRFPVVLRPPANLIVLVVLCLKPVNEGFEILHEWLGTHFGLAGDHGHSLGPGLTEAQLHHITANNTGWKQESQ